MDTDNGKTIAIVSHLHWIGWLIAFIIQYPPEKRTPFGSFYIRQTLGLMLLFITAGISFWVPILGTIAGTAGMVAAFILWIMSLISAVNGDMKESPVVGQYFQEWFANV